MTKIYLFTRKGAEAPGSTCESSAVMIEVALSLRAATVYGSRSRTRATPSRRWSLSTAGHCLIHHEDARRKKSKLKAIAPTPTLTPRTRSIIEQKYSASYRANATAGRTVDDLYGQEKTLVVAPFCDLCHGSSARLTWSAVARADRRGDQPCYGELRRETLRRR